MDKELILGGPGAGKTTALISKYKDFLADGLDPDRILLITYTKKAQHEVRTRLAKELDVDFGYLKMVRTFHSFLWSHVLGWGMYQSFKPSHLQHFGSLYTYAFDDVDPESMKPSDTTLGGALFNMLTTKRATGKTSEQVVRETKVHGQHRGITKEQLDVFEAQYNKFKKDMILKDYTDCFLAVLDNPEISLGDYEAIMVDEGQDLNLLMWRVIRRLEKCTDKMVFAGDDDQSIYAFGGGDVASFLELEAQGYVKNVLPKSHRMRSCIFNFSQAWIKQLGEERYVKEFSPLAQGGELSRSARIEFVDLSDKSKTYLLLASANFMVDKYYVDYLKSEGFPFTRRGKSSLDLRITEGTRLFGVLKRGDELKGVDVKALYASLQRGAIKHGFKMGKTLEDDRFYKYEELAELHGLLVPKEIEAETLFVVGAQDQMYLAALKKRGYSLFDAPWIEVSTIHGAKGGEADIVILSPDLTKAQSNSDTKSLVRQFYVAATRAREKIILLAPKSTYYYREFIHYYSRSWE